MKDIDRLRKRSCARRTSWSAGSTGLALSGLIGLLFLTVLVWQSLSRPSSMANRDDEPASEFIPVSDYISRDHSTVDDNATQWRCHVEISWNDGSPQTHEITITTTGERGQRRHHCELDRCINQCRQSGRRPNSTLFEPGRPCHC